MELRTIESRVVADRVAAVDRSAESELRLATSLGEFAKALIATKTPDRTRDALASSEEAVAIRLRWLTAGEVSARSAGELNEALRLFEQAARHTGRRELAAITIRKACQTYRHVARTYPQLAGLCADGLSKCGVWLYRLDQNAAVAATEDAAQIRAVLARRNPELSGKYLASLSTLLRTLMVGRARKQAVAMYRERYSALTTPEMAARLRECRIEELDLTPKSLNALTQLSCPTLQQAGRLTQQQILFQTSGDLSTIEEINWRLALVGLRPLAAGAMPDQPSKPVVIGTTFGALSVYCPGQDAVAHVRAAVVAAYAAHGAHPVDRSTYVRANGKDWENSDPAPNPGSALGDDMVVLEGPSGGWVAVLSANWELAPLGRHPLALRLSAQWPVVSVATTENIAYELCWYEAGVATQYAALGRPSGQSSLDSPLLPLDFTALADHGADYATETKIRAAFGNTETFAKLTCLPSNGIRQASVPVSVAGDHTGRVLFFRTGE